MAKPFKKKAPKPRKPKAGSKTDQLRALREAKAARTKPAKRGHQKAVQRSVAVAAPLPLLNSGELDVSKLNTLAEFKAAGLQAFRRTLSSIFTCSELLNRAKKKLTRNELIELHSALNISDLYAGQLRNIAPSPRLRALLDKDKGLPANITVLYLLASMDEDEFAKFQKAVGVHADLTAADVQDFRAGYKADKKGLPPPLPKATRAARRAAEREAANNATAKREAGEESPDQVEINPTEDFGRGSPSEVGGSLYDTFVDLANALIDLDPKQVADGAPDIDVATQLAVRLRERAATVAEELEAREFTGSSN